MCLIDLIGMRYFMLDMLNQAIQYFKYTFTDKTDQSQVIGKETLVEMPKRTGVS